MTAHNPKNASSASAGHSEAIYGFAFDPAPERAPKGGWPIPEGYRTWTGGWPRIKEVALRG